MSSDDDTPSLASSAPNGVMEFNAWFQRIRAGAHAILASTALMDLGIGSADLDHIDTLVL